MDCICIQVKEEAKELANIFKGIYESKVTKKTFVDVAGS